MAHHSSGRSIPIFSDESSASHPSKHHPHPPLSQPCIFSAFDQCSWAEVRRAVVADPSCLTASHPRFETTPLDHAFSVLTNTAAIVDHCDRAGVASACSQSGPLTLRERLRACANVTLLFVTTYADSLAPPRSPVLHIALQARLAPLALALLEMWPALATEGAYGTRKTPLHSLASSLTAASAPSSWGANSLAVARGLLRKGADASAVDILGRNPLYELCDAFSTSVPPYGLTRRSRASFSSAAPLIRLLIVHGARPCDVDCKGVSPIHIAVTRTIDFTTILQMADEVYQKLVASPQMQSREEAKEILPFGEGNITQLPEDCLRRILADCSPRDAVAGIGLTNTYFRSVATSGELWRTSLSYPCTLDHARHCIESSSK